MKKRLLSFLLAMTMVISGCGAGKTSNDADTKNEEGKQVEDTEKTSDDKTPDNSEASRENTVNESNIQDTAQETSASAYDGPEVINISLLGNSEEKYYDDKLVPSVEPYSVKADFSNVSFEDDFKYIFYESEDSDELRQALIDNNFAVTQWGNNEFFDVYEGNRYVMFPSFVTVDSLMHTYHLYFAHLMKKSEKNYLSKELKALSSEMLSESIRQYDLLKGSDWEEAALRNLAFFYIGNMLQNESPAFPVSDGELEKLCRNEYDKIMAAQGIDVCGLTGLNEDYTQYKPRGYYEGDDELEQYFRAMMWYGRIAFKLEDEDTVKSAVLQTLATSKSFNRWGRIYSVTSFFAGSSDDPGYIEMNEIISDIYGSNAEAEKLTDKASLDKVMQRVKELKLPQINSIPVYEGEEHLIPSYRFMGQRFTIDAAIMQRLVYSYVKEDSNGERRYLPDTLDCAAALGSETALNILTKQGDTDYLNYTDNLTLAKAHFDNDDPKLWNASLYAGWLNTLRPLLEEKGEGYPSYMTSEEWTKKNLETFAGSYAELKHDTILYAKQLMAEMGGGDMDPLDDRGYVDPQPVVYSRFAALSNGTKIGLEGLEMIDDQGKEDLERLSEIALTLLSISEKELKNEKLTDEDYEFIRCYGGNLEHFWYEANKDYSEDGLSDSYQAPCPIIADIATDPNGTVLEVGTGKANTMYVVFPIDGELHIGRGSVYSFYQFTMPMTDRLTDSEWRNMLSGGYMDDNWNWVESEERVPDKPEWTMSYRIGN